MDGNINTNNNEVNNSNRNKGQNSTEQKEKENQASRTIDYNKIEEMIEGRNAKIEDSILKSYFEKQGLSKEEMEIAIQAFKSQKENQANEQNQELSKVQESLRKMQIENQRLRLEKKAFDYIEELNVDTKTMPYILRMADLSKCVDKEGKVEEETLKAALEEVITNIPGLKKQVQGTVGITIGADTTKNPKSSNNVFDFGFAGVREKRNK